MASNFNIQDLLSGVGRAPAYPFQFPSLAQQMLSARPTPPIPVKSPVPAEAQAPIPPQTQQQPGGIKAALTSKIPIPIPPQRQV